MLIDVSDVKTIPIEIEDIIINSFRALSFDVENKIKNTEIQYLNDVMCAIEDIYAPFGNVRFYDEMVSVFEKYDLVCFHSTRMLLIGILQSDVDLSECVRDGNAYEFNEMRKEYRQSLIDRSRSIEAINEGDYSWFDDYDDEPEVVLDKAENDISRYEYALVSNLAGDKYITNSKSIEEYKIYLGVLSKFLCRIDLDISDGDTILSLAACYFIVEYYKANPDTTVECLKDFIAGRKISDYFDSICKESKNPHLAQIADEGCLLDELENCKDVCHRKADT